MATPTVLIVPGLREHVAEHWQTVLAARLPRVRVVPPMGRKNLDCHARVESLEYEVGRIGGPIVLVAHSGGVITVAHWAHTQRRPIRGALLATPPDFEQPMPEGYPTMEALRAAGWLPVPRDPLPPPQPEEPKGPAVQPGVPLSSLPTSPAPIKPPVCCRN